MSTVMILLGYAAGVGAALGASVWMTREIIARVSHHNEDAMLEIHKLGGTGKVALRRELESFGWQVDGSDYVSQIAGRGARLTFASGMWALKVGPAPGPTTRPVIELQWGFQADARSHGWTSADLIRCDDTGALAAMGDPGLRDTVMGLARFAAPRGVSQGALRVESDGSYMLNSGPQRGDAVLDPRNWSGEATLIFEALTRALDDLDPSAHDALLRVVDDDDAPARARALALASLRQSVGVFSELRELSVRAPSAPFELKLQWALAMPNALEPDEAYALLVQAVTMSEGPDRARALETFCSVFAARAFRDRRLPPEVRASALAKASRSGLDTAAEIERVLREERGSYRILLIERLGAEDPEALRGLAGDLIEQGHQPVVRAVLSALVKTREPRDRALWLRALETPGTHHGDLIESLEAFGDAACARALVGFASSRDDALGRQAQAAAARIAERVGALGSLSVSDDAGRGALELARRSGAGDISQV